MNSTVKIVSPRSGVCYIQLGQWMSTHASFLFLPAVHELSQLRESRWLRISNLCIVMLIAGLVLDALSTVLFVRPSYRSHRPVDVESLPYRSTYSRLDDLYLVKKQKSSRHAPLNNIPRMMTQVSMSEPERVFPPWPEMYLGTYGYVPTAARRLLANDAVSFLANDCYSY